MSDALSRRDVMRAAGAVTTLAAAPAVSAEPESGFIRLALNENPYGPSEKAKRAMEAAVDGGWMYDFEDANLLRRLIANQEGLKPENVFIAEGSGELLKLAGMIYGGNGAEVVAAMPTFPMLPQYAARSGGQVKWVNVDQAMRHDLGAMQAQVTDRTGVIYICNPNNPTGTVVDPSEMRRFLAAIPPRCLVVVDEAYLDFADDPKGHGLVDQVKAGLTLLVTRTFSKLHGLAGLRVGYGLAKPEIIRRLEAVRISIPNRVGLKAAIASYQDTDFIHRSRETVRTSVAALTAFFDAMDRPYTPTHGNFVMFDTGVSGVSFYEHMRARKILVSPVYEPFESWCRVSIGRADDMQKFTAAAREFFKRKT